MVVQFPIPSRAALDGTKCAEGRKSKADLQSAIESVAIRKICRQ